MKLSQSTVTFLLGLLSIIFILISGPGTRIGLYPFTAGLLMVFAGTVLGLITIIFSIIGLMNGPRNLTYTIIGLILGAISFGLIAFTVWSGRKAPMIHEISTDTVNPPAFVSILPLRKNAINPSEYGGAEVAKKQLAAFPDIKTIHLKLPPGEAFKKSLDAVHSLRWKLVDEKPDEGRIEAYDTTFWFGFVDDVVIRILPENQGSIVDIRSDSRVGGGDLGTNARRVRKYIKLLNF